MLQKSFVSRHSGVSFLILQNYEHHYVVNIFCTHSHHQHSSTLLVAFLSTPVTTLTALHFCSPVYHEEAVRGVAPPAPAKPQLPARTVPPKPKLLPKPQVVPPVPCRPTQPDASPVRPPRAPRGVRPSAPSSPPPRPKPFFQPPPEVKVKSFSLGRDVEPPVWDDFKKSDGSWPVRPPRRKHRPLNDFFGGHQLGRSVSLFGSIEEAERNIPIYATVNYNLKKNRRGQSTNSSKSADYLDSGSNSRKFSYSVFNSSAELLDRSIDTLDHSSVLSEQTELEHKKIYEDIESNLRTIHRDIADLKEKSQQSPEIKPVISADNALCMGNSECSSGFVSFCAKQSKSPSPARAAASKNAVESNEDESSSRLDEFYSATDSVHGSLNDIMPDILDQDEARVKAAQHEDNESYGSAENFSDSNYVTMSEAKDPLSQKQKSGSRNFLGRKKRLMFPLSLCSVYQAVINFFIALVSIISFYQLQSRLLGFDWLNQC